MNIIVFKQTAVGAVKWINLSCQTSLKNLLYLFLNIFTGTHSQVSSQKFISMLTTSFHTWLELCPSNQSEFLLPLYTVLLLSLFFSFVSLNLCRVFPFCQKSTQSKIQVRQCRHMINYFLFLNHDLLHCSFSYCLFYDRRYGFTNYHQCHR